MFVIKIVGSRSEEFGEEQWVMDFDPDAHAPGRLYPTGTVVSTFDLGEAKRFETFKEAYDFITQQSTVTPLRPDGEKNRPGTVLSIEISQVEV